MSFLWHILGHWAVILAGAAVLLLGVARPWKLVPDFLYSMAVIVGTAMAGGGYVYDTGFRSAMHSVEVAQLREDLAQAREGIDLLQKTAMAANERERDAAARREEDTRDINDYIRELARKGNDLQLSAAELDRLRGLVRHYQVGATRAATAVRSASRQSAGCRGLIAELTGALNEANSRLVRDFAFYADVRRNFCRAN